MRIRPLTAQDADPAREAAGAALPAPGWMDEASRSLFWTGRLRRLSATDPGGCWVAEDGGAIAGVALALVRDGIWGLALLAVRPSAQGRGIGRRLLDAALGHAAGTRGALIASSVDPRAMRRYARAGFDLRPCVGAGGIVDRSSLPGGLRSRPTEDLALLEPLGRAVRGGAYAPDDLALHLAAGASALRCGDAGIALHDGGSPNLVVARSEAAAADLLWSCLAASPPGATVNVDLVTARQNWAIRTVLDAGLPLSPDGPLFTRGELGPLRPWLPSGTFL